MSQKKFDRAAWGLDGGIYMTAGTAYTGGSWVLKITSDCTFTTLTSNITSLPDDFVITAKDLLPGVYTAVTLGTGACIALNAPADD